LVPEAGQAFANTRRFVIERELGHGGMGVVYQALDLERQTRVALKALTQRDAVNIYRLKNEFRQLADLSHPNLVTLHELCNEGNSWFFTMELVTGKTFDEYASDHRPALGSGDRSRVQTVAGRIVRDASITLSQRAIGGELPLPKITCNVKRLRHALRQLVEGVAALHEAGKLHRDLKPSNVLVTPQGRVVVLDFGLVSSSTLVEADPQDAERTVGGCVFGTPAYMSPEQAAGEPVTMASDWYSVGTMLYEALTGQLPFDGSVLEILRKKEEEEPPAPAEIARGVPEDLDQLCRELLRRDPRKRPSGPEILRHLIGHSAPPPIFDAQASGAVRKTEVFVGRERHLHELRDAFETAKRGKPVTVLVHGLSGMGKSALVRYFANQLIRADEAVVLRGRCYERETVPYKAFDNIIDALSRYMMQLATEEAAELLPRNIHALALLFPVLRRVKAVASARRPKNPTTDARELRNQGFMALKDLLLRITDFHPLVVNIDDLQWADMDSARLLSFLMGPPDAPPLLLIGTYRRDEAENSPFLKYLTDERSLAQAGAELRHLAVDPLRSDEAGQLAAALLDELDLGSSLAATAAAAEAEGIPFFITELVQRLKTRAAEGGIPLQLEPISLDRVILDRVGSMPEGAQRLLQVLSVAAGPLEQGVATSAAGLQAGDRAMMLALRAARLARTRGTRQTDTAETYHDRVRETIVRSMDRKAVRELHARIADALEQFEVADPERLVMHYSGAGQGVRAGETALQAAHAAAAKLAFNRAVELFNSALELLPSGHPNRGDLYRHIGDALANAGRSGQAAEAYLSAAKGCEESAATELQRMAARQYLRSGRIEEGAALSRILLEQVGLSYPENSGAAAARFLWNRALLSARGYKFTLTQGTPLPRKLAQRLEVLGSVYQELSAWDPLRGALLHAIFLRDALRSGDATRILQALAWEVFHLSVLGGPANERRASEVLAIVDGLRESLATPYATATYNLAKAMFALLTGRYRDAIEPAAEAERLFRDQCKGASFEAGCATTIRYGALEFAGNLKQMTLEVPQRVREAAEREDHFASALLVMSLAHSHLAAGRPAEALRVLDEHRARLGPGFTTTHHFIMHRTVEALLSLDDGTRALDYALEQWPRMRESRLYRGHFMRSVCHYMRARCAFAAYRRNPSPELMRMAEKDLRTVARLKYFSGYPAALRASILHHQGDRNGALELITQAVALFERDQLDRPATYARRRRGEMIGGTEGKAMLSDADAQLAAQGIADPGHWVSIHLGSIQT
jgi:eukaryotic-like serine/threonine-protein kinase